MIDWIDLIKRVFYFQFDINCRKQKSSNWEDWWIMHLHHIGLPPATNSYPIVLVSGNYFNLNSRRQAMKKKILIVDDEPQIVRLLSLRLKANNFDVISAYDGYQCVQVAKLELPDLILLDIKMPLGGGIKAFENLKDLRATSMIPVIFITAFPNIKVKEQVIDMGAEDFISKPFNSDVLIEKINTILNNKMIKSDDKLLSGAEFNKNSLEKN